MLSEFICPVSCGVGALGQPSLTALQLLGVEIIHHGLSRCHTVDVAEECVICKIDTHVTPCADGPFIQLIAVGLCFTQCSYLTGKIQHTDR